MLLLLSRRQRLLLQDHRRARARYAHVLPAAYTLVPLHTQHHAATKLQARVRGNRARELFYGPSRTPFVSKPF